MLVPVSETVCSEAPTNDIAQSEMNKYLMELHNSPPAWDPLQCWEQRMAVYPRLAPLAQDLINAPVAQAFVERISLWPFQLQLQHEYSSRALFRH